MKTTSQFIEQLNTVNNKVEVLSEYLGCKSKISVKCLVCNNVFDMSPNNLLNGQGCPICNRKNIYDQTRKNFEVFKSELQLKNPTVQILGEYISNKKHILVKCLKCGKEWNGLPCHLIRGHGCPSCANQKRREALRLARINKIK